MLFRRPAFRSVPIHSVAVLNSAIPSLCQASQVFASPSQYSTELLRADALWFFSSPCHSSALQIITVAYPFCSKLCHRSSLPSFSDALLSLAKQCNSRACLCFANAKPVPAYLFRRMSEQCSTLLFHCMTYLYSPSPLLCVSTQIRRIASQSMPERSLHNLSFAKPLPAMPILRCRCRTYPSRNVA